MSNWQRTLDISTEWKAAGEDKITPQVLAEAIATKLEMLKKFNIVGIDSEKDYLIERFKDIVEDPDADFDDLDTVMSDLYDWGDISLDTQWAGKKVCWVKTAF